jgi:hypothetical protein
MTAKDLTNFINAVTPRAVDFLYLRIDFTNQCNVGYVSFSTVDVDPLTDFRRTSQIRVRQLHRHCGSAQVLQKMSGQKVVRMDLWIR